MKVPMIFIAYREVDTGHDQEISSVDDWNQFLASLPEQEFFALRDRVLDSVPLIESTIETLGAIDSVRSEAEIDHVEFSRALVLQEMGDH